MVTIEKFYVFYDHNDFVRCCGTSRELVARGFFKNINSVHASATHIKQGVRPGAVAILEGEGKREKYSLIKGRKPMKQKDVKT